MTIRFRIIVYVLTTFIFKNVAIAQHYDSSVNAFSLHVENTQGDTKQTAGDDYIRLYQRFLSNQKNGKCPMYPSCSAYGRMAIASEPFYISIPNIADRLVRCSHDKQFYNDCVYDGLRRYIDYPNDSLNISIPQSPKPCADIATNKNRSINLINSLINKELFDLAMLEINRIECDSINYSLAKSKLICYRALGKQKQGIFEYETAFADSVKYIPSVLYQAALSYYELSNIPDLRRTLFIGINNTSDSTYLAPIYNLMALSYVYNREYESARENFIRANSFRPNNSQLDLNINEINLLDNIKIKSKSTARCLSIIPGLGYLYTGHKASALTSFIVNTIFGLATYSCFKKDLYALGTICGFVNLAFYIGNINGAARSATRYNQSKLNESIRKLEYNNQIFLSY